MIIYLSLLICLVGLVMWRPAAKEAGAVMFWVGLLAFLLTVIPHLVTLLH